MIPQKSFIVKFLLVIVLGALGSWSASAQPNAIGRSQQQTASLQISKELVAALNVQIPQKWDRYVVEGFGRLDKTGIRIIRDTLANVFKNIEAQDDRSVYTLLVAEHFRNDYLTYKGLANETLIVNNEPIAKKYVESADRVFNNLRNDMVATYKAEIVEINKQTAPANYVIPQTIITNIAQNNTSTQKVLPPLAAIRPKETTTRETTTAQPRTINAARIDADMKRVAMIEKRTEDSDKKLTVIEQRVSKNDARIEQIKAKQAQVQAHRKRTVQTKNKLNTMRQSATNEKRLVEAEQHTGSTEKRLAEIERRVDRSEKQLDLLDISINKLMKTVVANPQRAKKQNNYQTKRRAVVSNTQTNTTPYISYPADYDVSKKDDSMLLIDDVVATPVAVPAATPNVFLPTNKAGNECSAEACNEIENWLMDWYVKYSQYPEEKKKTSKFVIALQDTKDIYDKQRLTYPRKLKFLLKKFEMIP